MGSYRVRTICWARPSMFRAARAGRWVVGLYIPGKLTLFRRSALRAALAGIPSTFRWRANSWRHSRSMGLRILRWYNRPSARRCGGRGHSDAGRRIAPVRSCGPPPALSRVVSSPALISRRVCDGGNAWRLARERQQAWQHGSQAIAPDLIAPPRARPGRYPQRHRKAIVEHGTGAVSGRWLVVQQPCRRFRVIARGGDKLAQDPVLTLAGIEPISLAARVSKFSARRASLGGESNMVTHG
jgi:hypothetical protein